MSIFNDKTLKSVADIAAKIMQQEATHPKTEKEKDLAAMGHPKDKITHKDVLIGRGVLKKEETEQLDELSKDTLTSYRDKANVSQGNAYDAKMKAGRKGDFDTAHKHNAIQTKRGIGLGRVANRGIKPFGPMTKEEVENLDEVFDDKDPVGSKKKTTMGTATKTATGVRHERIATKGAEYGSTDWDKEEKDAKKLAKPVSRKLGARQNYVRSTRVNESFTEMIAAYKEQGLKSLVSEEPDNETFTKEVKDQIASMEGKKKQPAVAAPATQGVKAMPEEVEVLDADEINGVTIETIEEEVELVEGIISKITGKLANATGVTPQNVANSTIRALNKKAPGTKMHGHPNFSKFKSDVHAHVSSAKNAEEAIKRSSDNHVMSLAKKHFTEEVDTIEERTLTEPEAKKKEEVVKSMKKKLPGFKERYGERAKSVIYATATKIAKEKA